MSILINKKSKIIIQGFTGKEATFHAKKMIEYGTNIMGGVTPGKGGKIHLKRPVFNTVIEAVKETKSNVSIIFVPPNFCYDAIMESIESGIKIIVCITEGIPILDMIKIKNFIKNKKCFLIGPNCPGIISPEESLVGIMPGFFFKKGKLGIISKSGTLTYEVSYQLIKNGLGISTAVGIGGDPIIGTSIKKIMKFFIKDSKTHAIIMIGEIGGSLELEASEWIKKINNKKPVIGFIAGKTAPKGKTMGHAGAIISKEYETAQSKIKIMKKCGIYIAESLFDIANIVKNILY
jgi:succinyl-CoA synthetase alpha subunit